MRSRFFILVFLALIVLAAETPGQPDTATTNASSKAPIVLQQKTFERPIELPSMKDRLWMCGLALVLLGGLALGINMLRIEADRQMHRDHVRDRV